MILTSDFIDAQLILWSTLYFWGLFSIFWHTNHIPADTPRKIYVESTLKLGGYVDHVHCSPKSIRKFCQNHNVPNAGFHSSIGLTLDRSVWLFYLFLALGQPNFAQTFFRLISKIVSFWILKFFSPKNFLHRGPL